MKKLQLKEKWQTVKNFLKPEVPVLVTGIVAYIGVSSFFAIGKPYLTQMSDYRVLAIVITIAGLRKTWNKTRHLKAPWLIKLSVAFKEGFFSIREILPSISQMFTKVRGLLNNITKRL